MTRRFLIWLGDRPAGPFIALALAVFFVGFIALATLHSGEGACR